MPFIPVAVGLALTAAPEPSAEWSAPAGCPDRGQVLAQARALMGDAAAEDALQGVAIRGAIEEAAAGFVLEIDIETPSGATRKRVSAGDCTVLGGVAALMVAVAVDPVHTTSTLALGREPADEGAASASRDVPETGATPGADEPEDAATPERGPTPRTEALRARTTQAPAPNEMRNMRRSLRGFARASGSIGSGLVPDLDVGLAVGAGLVATGLRAELVAFHVLARDARYPAPSPAGASVAAWGGSVRVGPRVTFGAVDVHLLAGLGLAAMTATGFGVRNSRTRADTWAGLALIPGLRWQPHPRVALGADLEAEVALRRPAFFLDDLPIVYRTPRLGVRATAVVEIRWGGRDG